MTHLVRFSRRTMLGTALCLIQQMASAHPKQRLVNLYVGTFNTAATKGTYPLTYDTTADTWTLAPANEGVEEVAFAIKSRKFGLHYVAEHRTDGKIAVYRAGRDGRTWDRLCDVPTFGSNTTYIALNRAETAVVAANYNSGNIVLYHLDPKTGLPAGKPETYQDEGSGPVKERQAGPHAHWVRFSPDQRALYAIDLGTDEIYAYRCTPTHATLTDRIVAYKATPGAGLRHMAFHPRLNRAYLVAELNNTVTVLERHKDSTLTALQTHSVLPEGFNGKNQAAHIEINRSGTRLYVSNRGHNSIVVFAIGSKGDLTVLGYTPTLGDWPRFFLLLEEQKRLLAVNERSGDLVPFRILPGGMLEPTGQILPKITAAVFAGRI